MSPHEPPSRRHGAGFHSTEPPDSSSMVLSDQRLRATTGNLDLALATWENEGGREVRGRGQRSQLDTGPGGSPMESPRQATTGDGE